MKKKKEKKKNAVFKMNFKNIFDIDTYLSYSNRIIVVIIIFTIVLVRYRAQVCFSRNVPDLISCVQFIGAQFVVTN